MAVHSFLSYLELEKNYSRHTVGAYRNDILAFQQFCRDDFDIENIDSIAYGIIRSWIITLVSSNISNRTVNRKIASLKAYYKFLQRIGVIEASPLAKHVSLKTPKKVEVPFSEEEMENVLSLIHFENDLEGRRDKLIIELLYATGIRRSELINIKMADVDLSSATLKVLGKRNKERMIPLLPSTIGLFKDYYIERDQLHDNSGGRFVFLTKTGNKIYETLVYRIINGYFSKVSSKVKKSPHILRHTFATHLLNKGADLNSVKELLGHSSLASTQVYTHNSIEELKKVHSKSHPRSKK